LDFDGLDLEQIDDFFLFFLSQNLKIKCFEGKYSSSGRVADQNKIFSFL